MLTTLAMPTHIAQRRVRRLPASVSHSAARSDGAPATEARDSDRRCDRRAVAERIHSVRKLYPTSATRMISWHWSIRCLALLMDYPVTAVHHLQDRILLDPAPCFLRVPRKVL
jgi:hypothetical protein